MFPEERQAKICDLVNEKSSMKVSELGKLLNTSEVTIRRDLEELAQQKRLLRTHGGAIAIRPVGDEITAPELIRSHKNVEEKRRIAQLAYSMISEKDTLFMDGSSTVHELVNLIAKGDKQNLFIITTSLSIVAAMADSPNAKVIMLAGEVNYRHNHVEGNLTAQCIRNLRADKCFIGINGIDPSYGFSTPRFIEADVKSAIIRSSLQSFILADSSKFGNVYMARVEETCDYVITDCPIKDYDYQWLTDQCIVLFAEGASLD